jgi:two-component system response regulator YesN
LGNEELSAVHFTYDSLRSILVLSFQAGIKINPFERATQLVNKLQVVVKRTLKINLTFIMGKNCQGALELKHELTELLAAVGQRFYLPPSSIEKRATISYAKEDLFSWYDEALKEFRDILMDGKAASMKPTVARWVGFIQQHSFGPETVKDWVLKLVLDLKLKLQSMQLFRNHFSVDILHREILDIATLVELEDWLTDYFENSFAVADEVKELSKRPEIWSACQYVSLHLDKKISLDEVAEHLFLNPSYFSRLFKKEMGETYIEYVSRMKVARAKELLDQTNLTVGKICEMLGYDNHSYFVKMFKTVAGVTPMEYRGASASRDRV